MLLWAVLQPCSVTWRKCLLWLLGSSAICLNWLETTNRASYSLMKSILFAPLEVKMNPSLQGVSRLNSLFRCRVCSIHFHCFHCCLTLQYFWLHTVSFETWLANVVDVSLHVCWMIWHACGQHDDAMWHSKQQHSKHVLIRPHAVLWSPETET